MVEFEVKTGVLERVAYDERMIQRTLNVYNDEIRCCSLRLQDILSTSASTSVKSSINNLRSRLSGTSVKTGQMGDVLYKISELYKSAEKEIIVQNMMLQKISLMTASGALLKKDGQNNISSNSQNKDAGTAKENKHFDIEGEAKTKIKGKSVKSEVSGKATAVWIDESIKGEKGIASGSAGIKIGTAYAEGKLGAEMFDKNGLFAPGVYAGVGVGVAAVEAKLKGQLGSDDYNLHGSASGKLLYAKAEAEGGVGVIQSKGDDGKVTTEFGIKGKAGAEAYAAQGTISGGIEIKGVKVDLKATGKAGGAGATAEGKVTTGGISGEVGVGLGVGGEIGVEIDYSEALYNALQYCITNYIFKF